MPEIGKILGHYKILEQLGKGGMGEVYKAKDQKLGRDVAIKVLPEDFARDEDRIARFQREAKLLASLNHPNIAAIHGLEEYEGTHFLVLELIEGDTLAERIVGAPVRAPEEIREILRIALQIAKALKAAHEKGVIHRDLKPANIKVTHDGKIKVLDFGLAKAFATDQEKVNLSNSLTLSNAATQSGVILGTAAYMSPEQARGKSVDKRTDIWAFGCVLYEMLTGQAVFSGEQLGDILAAVIRAEPDWGVLPKTMHWRLRETIERCLQKDPGERYHDISDVRLDIQKALADPRGALAQPAAAESLKTPRTILLWVSAIIILTAIIAGLAGWNLKQIEPLHPIIRFDHDLPEDQHFNIDTAGTLAVSPDGSQFVYKTAKGIYLRSMNELDARLMPGTDEHSASPFFSFDGQWIGYFSTSHQKLEKIPISGGSPVALCDAKGPQGPIWYSDDTIVYADVPTGIMRISANGGTPEVLVEGAYASPQLLPDGKSIMYTDVTTMSDTKIIVQSLESGEKKELFKAAWAQYLPSGYLVYILENNLYAVPFDGDFLEVTGGVPIVDNVFSLEGVHKFAVSDSGTLAYIPGVAAADMPAYSLVWVDRDGKEEPLPISRNSYTIFSISPDGTKVALAIVGSATNIDIWIWDFVTENPSKLTFDEALEGRYQSEICIAVHKFTCFEREVSYEEAFRNCFAGINCSVFDLCFYRTSSKGRCSSRAGIPVP